ncbi:MULTISPECIES: ester cyclase [Nonomuraea]|uniref:Ester cyclase n=2 Tax=Nonomuraea TaxID=83681 RepID=A0ABW1C1G9_9ACTN|nr:MULTISPECIES: ester cyclase [Nonomuraea]MDA0643821.1 ester cyclase [Nonomuraea ferruginea]
MNDELATVKAEREEVVRRFRGAVLFSRDLSAIEEVLAPEFVDHFAPPWDPPGRDGVAHRFGQAADALTTTKVEVLVSVCEGEFLSQAIELHFAHTGEFMGIPATGRSFAIGGSNTFRFDGRQIVEHWGVFDVAKIPDLLRETHGAQGGWASMWPEPSRPA